MSRTSIPWNYYWVTHLERAVPHGHRLAGGWSGSALLAVVAWRERRVDAVTVIAWLVVPLTLMSIGTSKLHHYAYPFLPPVALMVGFGPGWLARTGAGHLERLLVAIQSRLHGDQRAGAGCCGRCCWSSRSAAAALALATLILGTVALEGRRTSRSCATRTSRGR